MVVWYDPLRPGMVTPRKLYSACIAKLSITVVDGVQQMIFPARSESSSIWMLRTGFFRSTHCLGRSADSGERSV